MPKDSIPFIAAPAHVEPDQLERYEEKQRLIAEAHLRRLLSKETFLKSQNRSVDHDLHNLFVSSCYNCNKVSVWLHNRMLWPENYDVAQANPDLPQEIQADYNEAAAILNSSPRGAAALLRLAIQKLCKHLGERGDNINADIASLVRKGLDQRLQQALDVVRVIGNEAVHPGTIDLRDNRTIAESLFKLVNLIAEKMISEPKHVEELFNSLPEGVRQAIGRRDSSTT
jgi:hypothetical protein